MTMASLERVNNVLVLGSTTKDEVNRVRTRFADHFIPGENQGVNFTTAIDSEYEYLGGTGINIACNLRRFYGKDIYLFSVVGNDNEDISEVLARHGVKEDYVLVRSDHPTSKAKGIIDKDENHIWLIEDSVTKGTRLSCPQAVDKDTSLALIAPIRKALFMDFTNWAIENEIDYVFDPGMLLASISEGELAKGVKSSKWLIANETEMKGVLSKSGITFDEIRASGTNIVVTRGANGAVFYDKFQEYEAKGITPALITDTSGAGDAWRAAFWGSLLMGENLERSLKIANSWASFSVEKHGVIGNYPDMNEVYRRAGL